MHPKAIDAMKKHIKNWLESIELPTRNGAGTGAGWSEPPKTLEAAVKKEKTRWLNSKTAHLLLMDALKKVCPEYLDLEGGMLSERVNIDDAAELIFNIVDGVPYKYKVYFELDIGPFDSHFSMELNNTVALGLHEADTIKMPGEGWLTERRGRSCYFSVETMGYISSTLKAPLSEAVFNAQGALKVFLERGLASTILRLKSDVEMWISAVGIRGLMYVHRIGKNNHIEEKFTAALPQDLATLLKRITSGYTRFEDASGYFDFMEPYLKMCSFESETSKRIRAASEWRLDSLADPSITMSLVKVCIGLESIFGDAESEGGLTKSLADRCAYSLAENHEKRLDIIDRCKELYRLRSKIVHGVVNRLNEDGDTLLEFGDGILKRAINKESSMLPKIDKGTVKFLKP